MLACVLGAAIPLMLLVVVTSTPQLTKPVIILPGKRLQPTNPQEIYSQYY
jgi:hypothetical protein